MNRTVIRVALAVAILALVLWRGLAYRSSTLKLPSSAAIAPDADSVPAPHPQPTHAPALVPPPLPENGDLDLPEGNIRDHRAHDGAHPLPPLADHLSQPPDAPGVSSKITGALHAQLRAAVMDCGKQIPVEQRGVKPRIQTRLTVSIHGGIMRVDGASTELNDVVGASVDPTKACVEHSVIGASIPAPDEAERQRYEIAMTYVVL